MEEIISPKIMPLTSENKKNYLPPSIFENKKQSATQMVNLAWVPADFMGKVSRQFLRNLLWQLSRKIWRELKGKLIPFSDYMMTQASVK